MKMKADKEWKDELDERLTMVTHRSRHLRRSRDAKIPRLVAASIVIVISALAMSSLPVAAHSSLSLGVPPGLPPNFTLPAAGDISNFGQFTSNAWAYPVAQASLWDGGWMSIPDLGGGYSLAGARPVNDWGRVVGWGNQGDGAERAWLWTDTGGTQNLGTLPGGGTSVASFVNEAGWVAGVSTGGAGPYGDAVVWTPDVPSWSWPPTPPVPAGIHDLSPTDLGDISSMNDRGQLLVVSSSDSPTLWQADPNGVLYQVTLNMDDPISGGVWSTPQYNPWYSAVINNRGQVAATASEPDVGDGILFWQAGAYTSPPVNLGVPSQHNYGPIPPYSIAINDRGQVLVGFAQGAEAFVWTGGVGWQRITSSIGAPGGDCLPSAWNSPCSWTEAYGLNNEGQVVGAYSVWTPPSGGDTGDQTWERYGFVWSGGLVHLLPTPGGGLCCAQATMVSDAGHVAGLAWDPALYPIPSQSGFPPPPVAGSESFVLWQRDLPNGDRIGDGIDTRPYDDCVENTNCAFDDRPGANPYDPSGLGSSINDGTTFGKIVARNGNRVAVVDIPPGVVPNYDGVKILNLGDATNPDVTYEACAYPFTITIHGPGGGYPHCSTLDLAVGAGLSTIDIPGNPVSIPAGAAVAVNEAGPGAWSITVDPESIVAVRVGETLVGPGQTVIVQTNSPPSVAITGPPSGTVVAVGSPLAFTGTFTDAEAGDTHIATWQFGSLTIPGTVTEGAGSGSVTDTFAFASPGVYTVSLTVTDDNGGSGTATTVDDLPAFVVVYDPNGGYVTGGGWFTSAPGSFAADPAITGKASFGFVAKYQKGASLPSGQTEFQFQVADLNFHSTSYDWLVCGGPKCQFKGHGTINGVGGYSFLLTAIDGQLPGGGGQDKLRMKIWVTLTGQVVYDNQVGADDFTDPTTVIGGGSIVIHKE